MAFHAHPPRDNGRASGAAFCVHIVSEKKKIDPIYYTGADTQETRSIKKAGSRTAKSMSIKKAKRQQSSSYKLN